MSISEFLSAVVTLTMVMDPLGNIPLFISVLKNVKEEKRKRIVLRELLFALFIMLFFFLFGKWIVSLFSMDIISLSIAGGIVLFLIALSMIFPSHQGLFSESQDEPFIVPLAVPLIAGPSVLSMILIYNMKDPGNFLLWFFIIIISWSINAVILLSATKISKFLGQKGSEAIERLMGMILITISIKMILDGIGKFIAEIK